MLNLLSACPFAPTSGTEVVDFSIKRCKSSYKIKNSIGGFVQTDGKMYNCTQEMAIQTGFLVRFFLFAWLWRWSSI